MKKILLFSFFLFFSFSGFSQEKSEKKEGKKTKKACEKEVFICNSMTSKAYHFNKECVGLRLCKDTIVAICKEKAEKKFGRLLCSYEKRKN